MAATIAQQPNSNNAAYAPNVWVLSGLATADRYVLRVKIGGTVVATFKQPANPSGEGMFNVSKVLQSYLEPYFLETTSYAVDTRNAHLTYQVDYGTETGNLVTIDGTSTTKFVINSYGEWFEVNADLTPFIPTPTSELCENSNINARYAEPFRFLTNYPETYKVRLDEYKTISFYNRIGNFNDGTMWGPNEAPFWVSVTYFNGGSQVAQGIYSLSDFRGSSVRTDCNDMTVTNDDDNIITSIGAGPQNFTNAGINPPAHDSYTIEVYSYDYCNPATIADCANPGTAQLGDVIYTANFEISEECSKFDPVTISFVNQYGVKDYYTFDRRNTKSVTAKRNNYTKTLGSWSDTSFSIRTYDRGKTTFSTEITTQMTLQTNWLTDAVSEWMQELYISPQANIFYKGQWIPVTIATTTYEEKTEARNNILYQHEITVQFANNKKVQRG